MRRPGNRKGRTMRAATLAALVASLMAGCVPAADPARPGFGFAARYHGAKAAAPVLLVNEQWWRGLKDPVLTRLVDLALAENLSLAAARARVEAARAEVQAVPESVSVTGTTALQQSRASGSDLAVNSSLGFGWLLDPWGARKAQLRGATARLAATEAEADAARLLLLYNLANAYVDLRHRQRQFALAQDEQASRRRTLGLTRTLAAAEAATRLEIARSEARVAEIEARLPGLRAAIRTKMNEISVLAGKMPGQLPVGLEGAATIPRPALTPTVGIPADLLRNRPDIRISEAVYYAALADLDAAEAARYPRLSLSGTLSLGHLVGGGSASSHVFGPQLALPPIPGTSARATAAARAASVRGAEAQWRQTVIGAVAEVENALIDYQAQAQSLAAAGRSVRLYQEARRLTEELFTSGEATLTDLIEVDGALSEARRVQAEAEYRHALNFVALNVRLGSGASGPVPGGPEQAPAVVRK